MGGVASGGVSGLFISIVTNNFYKPKHESNVSV